MADLGALQAAWKAWDKAPPPAIVERDYAIELAHAFARALATGAAIDACALWDWLAVRWDAWRAYDAAHTSEQALRKAAADGMRSLLGVARNSAAQPSHAATVLQHWDAVCDVMTYCLLFENMTDPALLPAVRALAQLVANAATRDSTLQAIIWHRHVLGVGPAPKQCPDALQRLLASSDAMTTLASAVLLLNCIDTAHEEELNGDAGVRLMETLLNVYAAGLLADHASEVADETMHVTVAIVQRLLRCGLLGELLERLCPVEGEAPNVSASQITLLRVLAACLDERLTACQGARTSNRMSSLDLRHIMQKSQRYTQSTLPLLPLFCTLASYAASVMKQHVDHGDVRDFRGLVRAHMALLAVMQCLHLAGMCAQEDIVHRETSGDTELLARMRAPESGVVDACVGTYADCFDIVLALMHEANRFFPAQSPFQPGREEARRTMQAGGQDTTARPVSPGASVHSRHASDTGIHTARASDEERTPSPKARRVSLCTSDAPAKNDTGDGAPGSDLGRSATGKRHPVADDRPALHRLKCSALQLLGTLAFEPSGAPHLPEVRALQNRVREQGGLLDTLSLTQVDKHNPYIREYAIFTLRYLLAGNEASQAQVAALRPVSPEHTRTTEAIPTASGTASMQ